MSWQKFSLSLVRAVSALFVVGTVATVGGCQFVNDGNNCPNLDEVCPDLVCQDYQQNRDGCSICACDDEDPIDQDAGPNENICISDADCEQGEQCIFNVAGGAARPDDSAGEAADRLVAGTCEPIVCPDVAFVECPEGTELIFDNSVDPCGIPTCVPVNVGGCSSIDLAFCEEDPRCQLSSIDPNAPVAEPAPACVCAADDPDCVCEKRIAPLFCVERPSCSSDADCAAGQACYFSNADIAPPCDDPALPCGAPLPVGYCADDVVEPLGCTSNFDCNFNQVCKVEVVCSDCLALAPPPDGDAARPAPCEQQCFEQGSCVEAQTCFSDGDCGVNEACDLSRCGFPAPNGIAVACQGVCVVTEEPPPPPSGLCQRDAQCDVGERCAVELEVCIINPEDPEGGCYSVCVEAQPADYTVCGSDVDCAAGETCDVQNFCELPPGCEGADACPPVCYGRCVL